MISSEILQIHNVAAKVLDNNSASHLVRKMWRDNWFQETMGKLGSCDFIFADPDNGLCLDKDFKTCNKKHWKRLPLSEANMLSNGRTAVFYHHNTRRKGGHDKEILYWLGQLNGASFAIKFSAYSVRTFFVINASHEMKKM